MNTIQHKSKDEDLWKKFQEGDKTAFALLYKQHVHALYNFGLRFTKDTDLIKDTIQDFFVYLWKKRGQHKKVEHVKVYLYKSFRNSLLKVSKNKRPFTSVDINDMVNEIPGVISNEQALTSERRQKIQSALLQLSERQREVIHLKYFQNMTNGEIAEIMQMNYQSVSNLLQRGIAKLRSIQKVLK